jgi:ribosome-binding protein aMBF1 (putative translation factor)
MKEKQQSELKKTFDDIAKPLREAVQKTGFTRKDLAKAIQDVRKKN